MSFIEIVRPHRRDGRDVRAAIQKVASGLRLAIYVPEMLAPVTGLRPGAPYKMLFGTAEDFGRVALRPGGNARLRPRGQTLALMTLTAPWEGRLRDRDGRQMRLIPTRRSSTRCLHITDDERAPLIVVLPAEWFEPVPGAAVFGASEWQRRRRG